MYRLKYKGDKSVVPAIIETVVAFLKNWAIRPDLIIPIPPSKLQRMYQPVIEIAAELSKALQVPLNTTSLKKTKTTPQMKDVGDFSARLSALENAFSVEKDVAGKQVLLIDDLLQSGATMNIVAKTLKKQGDVKAVYALALTRTRS